MQSIFHGLSRPVVFKTGTQVNKRHKSSFNPFEKLGGKKGKNLGVVKALSKNPVQPFPFNLLSRQTELSPPLRRFYSYSLREVKKKRGEGDRVHL